MFTFNKIYYIYERRLRKKILFSHWSSLLDKPTPTQLSPLWLMCNYLAIGEWSKWGFSRRFWIPKSIHSDRIFYDNCNVKQCDVTVYTYSPFVKKGLIQILLPWISENWIFGQKSAFLNLETCMNLETSILTWKNFDLWYKLMDVFRVHKIISKSIMFPTQLCFQFNNDSKSIMFPS